MYQKKVLILRSAIGFFGAESVILEIAKGLATSHYKPIIGVFQNSHNPHLELVTCAQQNNIETAIFSCSHQFDFRTIRALCNFVKNKQISILNSHGYKANFYALMVKKFVQIPLVATCHPWLESSIRTKFYAWLDKNLLKKFDQITAISNIEKNEIRQRVAAHKISVINNGVDISRFAKIYNIKKIKAELGIKSDGKVVGTVGRL